MASLPAGTVLFAFLVLSCLPSLPLTPSPSPTLCQALPRERPGTWRPRRMFPVSAVPNIRSAFHFQPEANWMNDPNGPMWYKGYYHLFYQYNPVAPVWGNISWGHAVSRNMIDWTHLPIALQPDQWYDVNGVWSGSATILPDGSPVISYTGNSDKRQQLQCLAFPKDPNDPLLVEWVKAEQNPISTAPDDVNSSQYRDPSTAWQGPDKVWRMVVGARRLDGADQVLVLRSPDFKSWLVGASPVHSISGRAGAWECPDLYPVSASSSNALDFGYNGPGAHYVIKASFDDVRADFYAVGSYSANSDSWTALANGPDITSGPRLDLGTYYASRTFYDPAKQRRVLLGWVPELDSVADDYAKGWASLQAIPRTVVLDRSTGQHLLQWPIEEVEEFRGEKTERGSLEMQPGSLMKLGGASGSQVDIEVAFDVSLISTDRLAKSGPFGLLVLASDKLEESTPIFFEPAVKGTEVSFRTVTDLSRSSTRDEVDKPTYSSAIRQAQGGILSLRVLVDNTIVESFAQGGEVVTTARVYPTLATGLKASVYLFNNASVPIPVQRFAAWNLRAATFKTNSR